MIAPNHSIDDMLEQAEPYVRRVGGNLRLPAMDTDDVLQELRIHALHAAHKYDPSTGVEWATYLCMTLKMRKVDLIRLHGVSDRRGNKRQDYHCSIEGDDGRSGYKGSFAPKDEGDDLASTEWRDVLDVAKREDSRVYATVLCLSGMTMREAGKMAGYCEARVCQMMNKRYPLRDYAISRIKHLIGA